MIIISIVIALTIMKMIIVMVINNKNTNNSNIYGSYVLCLFLLETNSITSEAPSWDTVPPDTALIGI